MPNENDGSAIILVVHDVEEIRDGVAALLQSDGYRVDPARNEEEAVSKAKCAPPDLVLVSLGESDADVMVISRRIRDRAGLSEGIPLVIFCVSSVAEGAEVELANRTYFTRPDDFDQLRRFLAGLLHRLPATS